MTDKIYVVTDLGPGDGGKGGVVHKVAQMAGAHTIVKVGGAQGSHGVSTSRGERFAFSQWGCGTFEGIKTHISNRMVVSPIGLFNEAETLKYQHGVHDPFSLLTIDEEALCATPYHGIASRLKEMARGEKPRGTIGSGVGEAYRDVERLSELAIWVYDLVKPDLRDKLAAVRDRQKKDLAAIIAQDFLPADKEAAEKEINRLNDDGFLDYVVSRFKDVAKQAKVVDADYFGKTILGLGGAVVVESSHGILTDCLHGFHPHTSALRTLPCFTHTMLRDAEYFGPIVNIGVTRAYQIRHGAGPMPTDEPAMAEKLLPGSHKNENRFQGKVRVGPLDLVLLKYAIEVCGGPTAFDGLAVTWFDQIKENGVWHVCRRYENDFKSEFFSPTGRIIVRSGDGADQFAYQERLGQELFRCRPEIRSWVLSANAKPNQLYSLCREVLEKELEVPVRLVSFGPTECDKVCR